MPTKIDITGTSAGRDDNWEQHLGLIKEEYFKVKIMPTKDLWFSLNTEQQERMRRKLVLVERFAANMAAGMLKGTLKYPKDDYSPEEWISVLVGEQADLSNYVMLLLDNAEKSRKDSSKDVE